MTFEFSTGLPPLMGGWMFLAQSYVWTGVFLWGMCKATRTTAAAVSPTQKEQP